MRLTSVLLVPSPLLGASSFAPAADAFSARGVTAVVASLRPPALAGDLVERIPSTVPR